MRKRQLTEVLDQLGAYRYLQDRAHDTWLPDSARQQVRQIINRYTCRYISSENTAGRINSRERTK